jgi:hypothetical protein
MVDFYFVCRVFESCKDAQTPRDDRVLQDRQVVAQNMVWWVMVGGWWNRCESAKYQYNIVLLLVLLLAILYCGLTNCILC